VIAAALLVGAAMVGARAARADEEAAAAGRGGRSDLPEGWSWPPTRDMRREGRRCLRELRGLGVHFLRVPRMHLIATPVIVHDMTFGRVALRPTRRKPPFVMDCRLARAFAAQAGALAELGVRELRFSTIYQVRNVRLHHRVLPHLSRHSLGLAVDIAAVVMADGTRLVVRRDYWTSPAVRRAELALRAGGGFRVILSPAVDPESHGDHLHMEAGVEPAPRAPPTRRLRPGRPQPISDRPAGRRPARGA
jgi:hypothetical protein